MKILHNRTNYFGLSQKIDSLPHQVGHQGSWFGLPDYSVTETIGDFFGLGRNSQGGSILKGDVSQASNQQALAPAPGGGFVPTPTPMRQSTLGASTAVPTNTVVPSGSGSTSGANQNGVPYAPTHVGQTIEINGNTYRSNANGGWDLVSGAGTDETNRLIDEAYGASNNYLNQAEEALRADYPTVLSEIDAQHQAGLRTAESGKTSTLGQIGENELSAINRNQNVMADARRLYDELRRGYGQRFGGASSAGLAASEISAVEQQRQQGRAAQEFSTAMRQINASKLQVEEKYQDQLFQLNQTKDAATNEANRDFQNKLLQISQSRAQNEQAKAQERLAALRDLRDKVYQINLQNMQFQQTLAMQKQQADLKLQAYGSQLTDSVSNSFNALSALQNSAPITTNLQSGQTGKQQNNLLVGAITPRRDDLMGYASPLNDDEYQSLLV